MSTQEALTYVSNLCWVPIDVLVECMLKHLPVCTLISCYMVCKHLNRAARIALENASHKFVVQIETLPAISFKQDQVIASAFEHGSETFLRWLETTLKYELFTSENLMFSAGMAAARGDINTLEFIRASYRLRKLSFEPMHTWPIYDQAAKRGHLHVLRWARHYGWMTYDDTPGGEGKIQETLDPVVTLAAGAGQLAVIQLLCELGLPVCVETAVKQAAANGHIALIEWLLEQTHKPNFRRMKYMDPGALYDLKCNICVYACSTDDTKTLQWALGKDFPFPAMQCLGRAIETGSVLMAEFIISKTTIVSPLNLYETSHAMTVNDAVRSKNIEMLRWLHTQVPIGFFQAKDQGKCVVSVAAATGNLAVLQWTLANGYSPRADAFMSAIRWDQAHVARWILQDDRFVVHNVNHHDLITQCQMRQVQNVARDWKRMRLSNL